MDESSAPHCCVLAVEFEQLQAELRAGLRDDELDDTGRAILHHIENSVLNDGFERGETSLSELESFDRSALANLAQRLDEAPFGLTEESAWITEAAQGRLMEGSEFTG